MYSFLGSGSTLVSRSQEPIYDRFEYESDDEEFSEEEAAEESETFSTLAEVGYSFTPFGGIILHSKKEKVNAIFKKSKLPRGAVLPKLGDNECGICFTEVDSPSEMSITSCGHRYCRECLAYYLHLESGDLKNLWHTISYLETTATGSHHLRIRSTYGVRCPHPNCHHVIEPTEFMQLVEKETWERFNDLTLILTLANLKKEGDIAPCPEAGCGGFVQHCICTSELCRRRRAAKELRNQHILYRRWLVDERNSAELLRKWSIGVARQCPKCDFLIEKNGGCDHMYCVNCQTRYNWSESKNSLPDKKAK